MIFDEIQSKRIYKENPDGIFFFPQHSGGRSGQISGTLSTEFQDCQKYTNLILKQTKQKKHDSNPS